MSRAVYIGRFRIFHKGYLEVIKYILGKEHSQLIVAIGAAQQSHCLDNPFSGEERAKMVSSALREEGLNQQTYVIPIDETSATYKNWARLVEKLCPPFQLVYSHNELVQSLFHRLGYQTSQVPPFTKSAYSFGIVTRKMINCESWHNLLPSGAVKIMKEYKLDQRIKELYLER